VKAPGERTWREEPLHSFGQDRWGGTFTPDRPGRWQFQVAAWTDRIATWQDELRRKVDAGQEDLAGELSEGAQLFGREVTVEVALASEAGDRHGEATSETYEVDVDRVLARFGSWYELFPRSWGGFEGVRKVLPELAGKFAGMAFRVPILDVSVVDLTVQLGKTATAEAINAAFDEAAGGELRGILAVSHEELVSSDFMHNPHSSIVDAPLTLNLGGEWAKVVSWYDNEWGFSCRMVDLTAYMAQTL